MCSRYREVRETEGSRNRDSTVYIYIYIYIYIYYVFFFTIILRAIMINYSYIDVSLLK